MDYRLVLSGTIGAGKSSILEKIAQYIRMKNVKVGCVREFIDGHKNGSKMLCDWIQGKISLKEFQDFISVCQVIDNEKIEMCPVKIYERCPYESAVVFTKDTYCYRHVLDQANELHVQYCIPYPHLSQTITIDANRSLEEVYEDVRQIVDKDLEEKIDKRVIFLKVNLQTSVDRIKARGRVSEESYNEGYLQNLIDAYEELFTQNEIKQ